MLPGVCLACDTLLTSADVPCTLWHEAKGHSGGHCPRAVRKHLKHTLVETLKLDCIKVGDREAWQKIAIGHGKPQVTVAHLWVSICFVFQTHEGLAREYVHKRDCPSVAFWLLCWKGDTQVCG